MIFFWRVAWLSAASITCLRARASPPIVAPRLINQRGHGWIDRVDLLAMCSIGPRLGREAKGDDLFKTVDDSICNDVLAV